jgi:RNase H-like domain found in reverse transcriptase
MVSSGVASRKQNEAEARYTVPEKECLAVLFGLQKFRQHLYGKRFGVVTDHSTLVWLMSLRDSKHRLARCILEFQSFDFDVEHAPGNESIMVIPDALSRDTMDKDLMLCARCLETVGSVEEELTQVDILRCADLNVCDRVKISRSDGYRPLKLFSVCDCIIEEDGESSRHDHSRE